MNRLLDLVGMSLGGWLGWIAGAWISIFAAFLVGVVGMGIGLYGARRMRKRLSG